MIVAGVDWSISCPAMTIMDGDSAIAIYSVNQRVSKDGMPLKIGDLTLFPKAKFDNNQQRFDELTENFVIAILRHKVEAVCIEDYAFAGNGRITDIAECVGVLKHKLYQLGITVFPFSPSEIKKFATGKGNADKNMMYDSFIKERPELDFTGPLNLSITTKIPSPIQDIVDAYWIAKYGTSKLQTVD